jgi:hypothetical protein
MTIIMSGRAPSSFLNEPRLSLMKYLYDMDAHEIDLRVVLGEADSMFQEPFVTVLAEHLRACLDAGSAFRTQQSSRA